MNQGDIKNVKTLLAEADDGFKKRCKDDGIDYERSITEYLEYLKHKKGNKNNVIKFVIQVSIIIICVFIIYTIGILYISII